MGKLVFILYFSILFTSFAHTGNLILQRSDSTITLFGDPKYHLTVHIFNPESGDESINNAVIIFLKEENGKSTFYFHDSMYCMYSDTQFEDFNNDKIKDVMVFHYTGHVPTQAIIYS